MATSALQLYGCLNRIRIEKVRNCRVTCCECCSHLIIILILVFGYGLSVIENFSAEKYSELVLRVPPQTTGDQPVALRLYKNITRGPLIIPTFDQYIAINDLLSDNVNVLGASGDLLSQTDFGRAFTNLLYKGSLHFAPRGDDVTSFVEYMNTTFTSFQTIEHYIHDTEEEAVDFILNSESDIPALALIVLRQITPEKVNYVIRQNYTTLPNTNQVIEEAVIGLNEAYQDYFFSGFLTLQSAVDNWAFNYTNAISGPNNPSAPASCTGAPQATFVPYPTPEYNQNPFYNQVGFLLGLAIVMSTMYPMSRLTKSVVEEKELKLREVMKIMGLQEWVHQLSWFLSAFLLFFWIAISCTVITKATFLVHTDASILFAYFFLFCMSEINFAFFVSVFFSNSKLAAIVAPVVLFAGLMPRYAFLNTNNNEQVAGKTLACLLSPTAFAFGADIIAQYEYGGVGVQYSNASDGDFNFNTILLMMWADFFIYGFLAWYLDQVIPHEYGTAQPLWFFLNWRYWCPRGRPRDTSSIVQNEALEDMPEFFDPADGTALADGTNGDHDDSRHTIEPIPADQRSLAQVRIKNLRKRYPDGNLAVRDFSLSMLEGQITCLLGHNGAGKTTTISTLTGMIEATSGDASIYGCSLQYDLPAIRQLTGVCPQHNVLYPCLTVLEHLYFFGNVKGMYGAKLRTSVESVIEEVGLTEKRNALSQALSGGMKRKLSLAIALIGDPKFLLLDEPTSGMDPYSRRSTWELLQKSKVGRVVLLTTHFMEEADTLADRIAIMSEGNVRCSGSSLFLKTRFGVGYLLSISKARADVPVGPIEHLVKDIVPEAKVTSSIAGEVILQMPMDTVPLFASLFCKLRDAPASLGVGSYGISLTTLEQVFISLAKEAKEEHEDRDDHAGDWHYWLKHYVVFLASEVYGVLCCRSGGYQVGSTSAAESAEVESVEVGDVEMIPTQAQHPGDNGAVVSLESVYGNKEKNILSDNALTAHPVSSLVVPVSAAGVSNTPRLDASPTHAHSGSKAVLTEDEPRSQKDTYNSHGFSRGTVPIQFIELYRKRLIIASRDIKGLFFQVIFPALQIVLIMLILTVSYNPAGHTITLHANMFDKEAQTTPIVQVAGAAQDNLYRQSLASVNMDLEQSSLLNSTSLSDFLLDPLAFVDDRYGAFLFGDSIPLHLTVDWVWVKENVNNLNDTIAAIPGAEDAINSLLADVAPDLNIEFNQTLPLVALNITTLSDADIDALTESLFNISISSLFNVSINSLFNLTAIDLSQSAVGGISADGVIYDAPTNSFELQNGTLTLNNVTTDLGSVTVPASEFAQFLPDTVESYDIPIPSQYTIMHNSTSPHGAAAFYGELIETVFQQCSPVASQQKTQYLIKNHPLPITISQGLEIQVILALLTSLFIIVPLCYIPASFVSFLVKERVSKSKHLQIVSSVSPYLYWTATYCWDITLFLVLIGFILGAFFCFGSAAEVFIHSGESTLALFCLLVTYGLSSVALSYLYSMAFDNFSTAQISIMVINFVTGFVMVLAYYILISVPNTEAVGRQLVHLFRFFPPYNIGEGLINLSSTYYRNSVNGESVGYFDWPVTGRNIVFMLVEAVGYFGIVLLTEFTPLLRFIHYVERKRVSLIAPPAPPKNGYDEDVLEEAERVKHIPVVDLARQQNKMQAQQAHQGRFQAVSTLIDGDIAGHNNQTENHVGSASDEESTDPKCALLIRELVKTYPPSLLGGQPKHAVRGVSLACNDGERFGLLGINGAGKTTTLGILTGDLQPTSGEVYIGGKPLSDPATMSMIGYCPQVDPLLDLMNGYETLWFFGRIRGIPKEVLEKRVNDLILQVGLEKFAHKPCGTYSGGNKRKLSLAVALIGDPRVLFLDEPSTGMDPEARRNMWTVIEQVSAERCVVLVTHSMEEVEALCTRMGVMVSGRMQCIGSAQHLKSRFGLGYQVEIRTLPARVQDCIALCEAQMLAAVVEEVHGGYVRLKVSKDLDLAAAFSALEHNKAALQILDYNISQCTLEQVFLKFAKDQEEETGHVGGVNIQGAMETAEMGTREGNLASARSLSSAPYSTLLVEVADPGLTVGEASPVVIVPSARRSPVNFENDPGAEEKQ